MIIFSKTEILFCFFFSISNSLFKYTRGFKGNNLLLCILSLSTVGFLGKVRKVICFCRFIIIYFFRVIILISGLHCPLYHLFTLFLCLFSDWWENITNYTGKFIHKTSNWNLLNTIMCTREFILLFGFDWQMRITLSFFRFYNLWTPSKDSRSKF